ncbi:ATP-dependent 6-phosphofructokinase [Meiothermus granaticius]|uniref:ATP-dependent 6-phosphofructokinase n=1 Tax=Meiothermus granaticius NBRC 107808 TaxID=1227551 RepID=A0A399FE12_9DEIN|nr:ATP-dependent 6-phosphofructokinase [Meiothermus granaticius]MCL6525593.1 ATP-dependent 6-phosphofructokinase [Thermaceae bacterium]RIH93699.1 ATP-dependent 6-phosphofructokinase [Meiothermus granaticius NBRC 107808]GEM85777.1 ATP-dependent 6-phosphofructokinase [Meiothermus granaticius NBRC 107808]
MLPDSLSTQVKVLGPTRFPNPLLQIRSTFVERDRVLLPSTLQELEPYLHREPPSFEMAGPRRELFFDPSTIACGILTCGGLCPGLNDVLRSVVLSLTYAYGVPTIYGFRYGYAGLAAKNGLEPLSLTPAVVEDIHTKGGTLLGSSRGPQELGDMIETLERLKVRVLFAVGGDGTLRGASALAQEILRRGLEIAVVGIPKTIDNDILWVERSFGFATAVEEATRALEAAHAEARGALGGIGLVKLMGRHSGFITAHASLANSDVNFCLVPEVPFRLEAFLGALEARLRARGHAVVAVAEGAAQELLPSSGERDASGNLRLGDVGLFLRGEISRYLQGCGLEFSIKYIDPSYIIRGVAANAADSEYCLALGQHAVHAGMAGRTDLMIGYWNGHFAYVPLALATAQRKQIHPQSELWQRVLGATGQPDMS